MASVGPAVVTSTTAVTSTATVTGQGLAPIARCRISYDDVSVATPTWSEISSADFRAFTSSRGRDDEHSEFDAGNATASIDNRDRAFDPLNNGAIRPLNRIWLYYEFSGRVGDIFKGYVSAWGQEWPGGGWSDAIATANAADEFSVLSQDALPTTSPPRDSYSELIASDSPVGYWDMNEDPTARQRQATEIADVPEPVERGPIELKRTDRRWANTRAGMLRKR